MTPENAPGHDRRQNLQSSKQDVEWTTTGWDCLNLCYKSSRQLLWRHRSISGKERQETQDLCTAYGYQLSDERGSKHCCDFGMGKRRLRY